MVRADISAKRNENPWNIEGKIIIYGPRCEWDLESLRMAIPFRSVKVSKYASSGDEHTAVANKDLLNSGTHTIFQITQAHVHQIADLVDQASH